MLYSVINSAGFRENERYLSQVIDGSLAEEMNIQVDDRLVKVNDVPIDDITYYRMVKEFIPFRPIKLTFSRDVDVLPALLSIIYRLFNCNYNIVDWHWSVLHLLS